MPTSPIDDYVAGLRRLLHGPVRARRDLLAEARDGLLDAAEAYEAEGHTRAEAERLAIEDFGHPAEIAPGYQEELAVGQARRTAALLFVSVPLTTLMWSVIWRFYPLPASAATPPEWFWTVSRLLDYIQLATGVAGGFALVAFGRGLRVVRRPLPLARALGLLVLLQIPVRIVMGIALVRGADGPPGFEDFTPGVAVSVITYVLGAWQLLSAALCLLHSRVPHSPVHRDGSSTLPMAVVNDFHADRSPASAARPESVRR
ncbi:permease prefix domain 1-containing protein [Planotetraspora kaengkrachanensis]|uniref:Uncharacterized protein n=1 Tax=Planotetraspora kaengkrachanensis TaxID=575193 RepID=A0A8J3PY43_9ACTN|nr:permease prefix domain 1-containing protein [Planotetraspora kaengkrachanensis]GIG83239.1 hypothetical protein Pka01_63660 [Planotetraspora kaengkrachanensis]